MLGGMGGGTGVVWGVACDITEFQKGSQYNRYTLRKIGDLNKNNSYAWNIWRDGGQISIPPCASSLADGFSTESPCCAISVTKGMNIFSAISRAICKICERRQRYVNL